MGIGWCGRRYFIERAESLGQSSGSPAQTRSKCGQSSGSDTGDTHSIALQPRPAKKNKKTHLSLELGGRRQQMASGGEGVGKVLEKCWWAEKKKEKKNELPETETIMSQRPRMVEKWLQTQKKKIYSDMFH